MQGTPFIKSPRTSKPKATDKAVHQIYKGKDNKTFTKEIVNMIKYKKTIKILKKKK